MYKSLYVSLCTSPGSPSKIKATLFLRHVFTCLSTASWTMLYFAPTNHFTQGASHSIVFFGGVYHSTSSLAISPQNHSQLSVFLYRSSIVFMLCLSIHCFTFVLFTNSFVGLKTRFSSMRTDMFSSV